MHIKLERNYSEFEVPACAGTTDCHQYGHTFALAEHSRLLRNLTMKTHRVPPLSGQLSFAAACMVLLIAGLFMWETGETEAGTTPPAWDAYAQHEATARYWLDDDPGPEIGRPQEVDEQEHVY